MASIIATLTALPGKETVLESALCELVTETAREPGAFTYELLRPEGSRDVFVVAERYRDAAARESHLASPHLKAALEKAGPALAQPPQIQLLTPLACIRQHARDHRGRSVDVCELPLGPVQLVYARTAEGLLACGAIDPSALERFGLAAARVKPAGNSVTCFADLLSGTVREANAPAQARGIRVGMSGDEALTRL